MIHAALLYGITALYANGLTVKADELQLTAGASLQFDSRFYVGNTHSFDIRRARVDLGGNWRWVALRLQMAFEDTPYLRNAYVDLSPRPWARVRGGQFKVPFSSQWLTGDTELPFLERPAAEPIYPFLDRGLAVWGSASMASWAVGVFDGSGIEVDAPKGDTDGGKVAAARVLLQQWGASIGGGGTFEPESAVSKRFDTRGLQAVTTQGTLLKWRQPDWPATFEARARWAAEASWTGRRLAVAAEWAAVRYHRLRLTTPTKGEVATVSGTIQNISAWASWAICGSAPRLEFWGWRADPRGLEVGLRGGLTVVDQALLRPVAVDVDGGTVIGGAFDGARYGLDLTVGITAAFSHHLRIQANYTWLRALEGALPSSGRANEHMWALRLQGRI